MLDPENNGTMIPVKEIEVGDMFWDFSVTAIKIAEEGRRFRVTVTGRTSGKQIIREGFSSRMELLRILAGYGSNVDSEQALEGGEA